MFALLLFAISIHTNFEGGNIEKVEHVSANHLRCAVRGETDQDKRNRQPSWFYFRLEGVAGRDLTIDLAGLAGEYNYKPHNGSGLRNMHPVYSFDDKTWTHFPEAEWIPEQSTVRLRLKPAGNSVWIARTPPYTNRHLNRLLGDVGRHPHFRQEAVGKTPEGRPMLLLTITNPKLPAEGKKVVWLMARQHSWESGTSWVAEGALRFLLSADPAAARLRDAFIVKMFPMADPDGVARGGVRFNKYGYDLNRNWDAVIPERMPEIHAQRQAVLGWVDSGKPVNFFLTLHNTEAVDYVQGSLKAGGPEMQSLAQRVWKLLDETTAFHAPEGPRDAPATTTPGMKGRMTVNQGLFHDRRIPAFLMELMVDRNPKIGRWPTIADRLEFGAGLIRALCAAVETR